MILEIWKYQTFESQVNIYTNILQYKILIKVL